jgi:hypothetical protein
VGKGKSLSLGSRGKQERAHTCCHTDTDGGYITLDEIHSVIDSHTCGNGAAGAVDVKADISVGILSLEEKKLCNHKGSGLIVDLVCKEYDTVIEKS